MSAVVHVLNNRGEWATARALLDTCATVNLITSNCISRLGLPTQSCSVSIGCISDLDSRAIASAEISLKSLHNDFRKSLSCLVVSRISDREPREPFPRDKIKLPSHLLLADPDFHRPRPVDILISAGATLSLIRSGQVNLSSINSDLILQQTRFGWVVVGGFEGDIKSQLASCHLTGLRDQIEKFWLIEEIGDNSETASEESLCEAHYRENTVREDDGRYTVRLPFRHGSVDLGDSRAQALRRFYSLHNKLESNKELKKEYHKVMQSYTDLGHMSLVETETDDGYYIPHHAVVKKSSSTTKLRVVFDASAKTSTGLSLNKVLMVGPTIQDKLFAHIFRFRTHVYVVTADIEQMYRQINVHPDDRKYQRIFWYHKGRISVYNLNTVTFGEAPSPFLAIRTLHQLSDDESHDFPLAAQILKRDVYVDDLLTGADTLSEVLGLRDGIISLLKRGGFNIRKWGSNQQHALDNIYEKVLGSDNVVEEGEVSKPLGVVWNSRLDKFIYTVKPSEPSAKYTKRYILSEISKIFDPLGLLGPIVMVAKLLMQECWRLETKWDEVVSEKLIAEWTAFTRQLSEMNPVSINRQVFINSPVDVQVHGFCDASNRGYGACIYIRSVNASGEVFVNLACSKSRVAPLKKDTYTIPRLELCGALVLARLFKTIENLLKFKSSQVVMWTDSTIVLHWLRKSPQTLKVFEANRIKEIQQLDDGVVWRHVRTHDNPADALSRGQYPVEFVRNSNWISGPAWLRESEELWPELTELALPDSDFPLEPTVFLTRPITRSFYANCSSYNRMLNFVALILRALRRKSFKAGANEGPITVEERRVAEVKILVIVQREQFGKEIDELMASKPIRSPKLSALCPFLDKQGLIRVGGRLRNSSVPYSQKHPILLPSYHHVTDLLIAETHLRNRHAGNQSTLFTLRQRFYLLDGKNQVRKVLRSCVECFRHRPVHIQYKMADLPSSRVTACAPFQRVGVDYFGPVFIKEKKFRNQKKIKTYGCVFVCMVTKAVHIEVAVDLSTEGFLAAFRRFIGRRGIPSDVYSDNGGNFVGANNQLRELYVLIQSGEFQREISSFAVQKGISWHFNPPESPHFGGIWEAAVKSFKHHLKRVIGDKLLTFEEIYTLLVEIEAVLNSRPLYAISSDPNDPLAITPGHILIGRPLTLLPEENLISVPENRLAVYKFISRARQDFWRRWRLEYLHELQKRQKWTGSTGEVKQGSVVVLLDRQQPCGRWPLAVVTEVLPGSDGVVRVVTVRTPTGSYTRNVTSICPLPGIESSE